MSKRTPQVSKEFREMIRNAHDPETIGRLILKKGSGFNNSTTSKLNNFCGVHSNEKVPRPRSHLGIKILFQNIGVAEWISGKLDKATIQRTTNALQQARGKLKKCYLDSTTDTGRPKIKAEITETKINIIPNLLKILKRYRQKTRTKPSKELFNKFMKRSQRTPVIITNKPIELLYADVLNGKPTGPYNPFTGEDSPTTLHSIFRSNVLLAYKGQNAKDKNTRAIIQKVRKFDRKRWDDGSIVSEKTGLAIFDMVGPIRQQKHIVETLAKLAKHNKCDLYLTPELRHRFRCDFKFDENFEKLITPMITLDNKANKLPSYGTRFVKSRAAKTFGKVYCIIKEAWKIK